MKLKVIEKGINYPKQVGENKFEDTPLEIGTILEDVDEIPPMLVGKVVVLEDDAERVALTNPAEDAIKEVVLSDYERDRQAALVDAAKALTPDDFTADGKPALKALNEALPKGIKGFDAEERDKLWEGVADAFEASKN